MTQAPIRIVTTLRTGSCPEGRVIEDRVLKPITPAERKQGVKDELTEWYRTFGSVRPVRRTRSRRFYEHHPKTSSKPQNDPPEVVQQSVYDEMHVHFQFVALDLANSGIINAADVPDVVHELFRAAIDSLPDWDPNKSTRKTYLYETTALNKIDVIRSFNSQKRQGTYRSVPITNASVNETVSISADNASREDSISNEAITERSPTSIQKLEFELALKEFAAMLDPDELLSLDYLLQGYEGTEVAEKMGRKYTTWRKSILESLQMKAECCGFYPHNK